VFCTLAILPAVATGVAGGDHTIALRGSRWLLNSRIRGSWSC
jgi:hypothetical protein